MQVDATNGVARVVFDNTANLGVIGYPKYLYGTSITVPYGNKQNFTIYNADNTGGSVSFTLAFTSAIQLILSCAVGTFVFLWSLI